MNNLLRFAAPPLALGALAALMVTAAPHAGATVWTAPKVSVTLSHNTVSGPAVITAVIHASACVSHLQLTATDAPAGGRIRSTTETKGGRVETVTLKIPASTKPGRWALSSVTGRLCGDTYGAMELNPASGGSFGAIVVLPALITGSPLPGSAKQEG